MFDVAWSELLLIGAVALIVIGPKDLPKAMRSVGETVGKLRRMAAEFQGQFRDAMREAELHDLKQQVEEVGGTFEAATRTDFNPIQTIRDELKGATEGAGTVQPAASALPEPSIADTAWSAAPPPLDLDPARQDPALAVSAPPPVSAAPTPVATPVATPPAKARSRGSAKRAKGGTSSDNDLAASPRAGDPS